MPMAEYSKQEAQQSARLLLQMMDPVQAELLDPIFESASTEEFRPRHLDAAHGFALGGAEVLAVSVAYVIGRIFYDAVKDAVKDEIKEMLEGWVGKKRELTPAQKVKLLAGLDRTAVEIKLPAQSRLQLRAAVEKVL